MTIFQKITELENRIKSKEDKSFVLNRNDKKMVYETSYLVNKSTYTKLSEEHTINNKLDQPKIK